MDYKNLGLIKIFLKKYFRPKRLQSLRILDVGSKNEMIKHKGLVFKRYFVNPNWKYIGVDISAGPLEEIRI